MIKDFTGVASYYNQCGRVASGGRYNSAVYTAAHRNLPFGTKPRVTDPKLGAKGRSQSMIAGR